MVYNNVFVLLEASVRIKAPAPIEASLYILHSIEASALIEAPARIEAPALTKYKPHFPTVHLVSPVVIFTLYTGNCSIDTSISFIRI